MPGHGPARASPGRGTILWRWLFLQVLRLLLDRRLVRLLADFSFEDGSRVRFPWDFRGELALKNPWTKLYRARIRPQRRVRSGQWGGEGGEIRILHDYHMINYMIT